MIFRNATLDDLGILKHNVDSFPIQIKKEIYLASLIYLARIVSNPSICRKKDLVKLQYGEYVSLGKVESVLKVIFLNISFHRYSSLKNNKEYHIFYTSYKFKRELLKYKLLGVL